MAEEIRMNEELLDLLEKKYENGEIDDASYEELKQRYTKKLEDARKNFGSGEEAAVIRVSGSHSITQNEVIISGAGTMSGGRILKNIRISGAGKVTDDLECNAIKCSGAVKIAGNVVAHGSVRCSGSFKSQGYLHADADITCSGSCKINGEVIGKGPLKSSGSFSADDTVQIDENITLSGSSSIDGNLISKKTIDTSGKVEVEGDIIGENVIFRGRRKVIEFRLFKKRELSTVEGSIFARNDVELDDVYVGGDVKGKLIKLGTNTKINGIIYYVDDLLLADGVELENEPVKISAADLKL